MYTYSPPTPALNTALAVLMVAVAGAALWRGMPGFAALAVAAAVVFGIVAVQDWRRKRLEDQHQRHHRGL